MMLLITSYAHPDLDGVASSIIYAAFFTNSLGIPHFEGNPNGETAGVLSTLGLNKAVRFGVSKMPSPSEVVLIDCHHPRQLPTFVDPAAVTLIIDHHPDGQPQAFPNATVQNDQVGAAATLIAERIEQGGSHGLGSVEPKHAALLACAIASNTLDFTAPSTTDRDQRIFAILKSSAGVAVDLDELLRSMRLRRQDALSRSTWEVVQQDVKVIESPIGTIAVSQVEADGARGLLDRSDLRSVLDMIVTERLAIASLLSLVDTESKTTYLCSSNLRVIQALRSLNAVEVNEFTLMLPFIALRKTHVIPILLTM